MKTNIEDLVDVLESMKGESSLSNYVVVGLSSTLLTEGTLRVFEQTRLPVNHIAPHSHRYDFSCMVLRGEITNHTWSPEPEGSSEGDLFTVSRLTYLEQPGRYEVERNHKPIRFSQKSEVYRTGEVYSMSSRQIHSTAFSKGSLVLFFEGRQLNISSELLEPFENGGTISLGEVKPWMFSKTKETTK